MPGETDLHKTLKKEACRWLFRTGYRCVAAEVRLPPLGIIDAVGTGVFSAAINHLGLRRSLQQVCFVECKATRSDFLRDLSHDGQMSLALMERRQNFLFDVVHERVAKQVGAAEDGLPRGAPLRARLSRSSGARSRPTRRRQALGLGKFAACLLQPIANLHYVLAPPGVVKKNELPPRWGLLSFGVGGISVVTRASWQECTTASHVESAIAATLTGDIHRADDRALGSVNREIFQQQQAIAERIRAVKERSVLVEEDPDTDAITEPRTERYSAE